MDLITDGMRRASQNPRVRALDGIVTASVMALDGDLEEQTKGVVRQVFRLVIDERSRIANELLGATPATAPVRVGEVALGGSQKPSETGSGAAAGENLSAQNDVDKGYNNT